MSNSALFEQTEMSDPSRVPGWLMKEYLSFHQTVADDNFPCSFGLAAEKDRELRYSFVEDGDLARLPQTLEAFLQLSRSHPDIRHNLTVFFEPEPEPRTFEYYKNRFWQVLNFLHEHDDKPWPREIPTDKDDPLWEFCFGGDPIFMFAASPAYVRRRSRNYGNSFIMLFQPKRIFKGIASESAAGTKVRRVIRSRLKKWDGADTAHPDVIDYGEALVYRWKQYLLSDDSTPATGGCPFHFRKTQDAEAADTRSEGETTMEILGDARIVRGHAISLEHAVQQLLPEVGSVKVRRDPAGFEHPTHQHDTDEILLIVEGDISFESHGRTGTCNSGDRLVLPGGTRHSSVAGENGCVYIIAMT